MDAGSSRSRSCGPIPGASEPPPAGPESQHRSEAPECVQNGSTSPSAGPIQRVEPIGSGRARAILRSLLHDLSGVVPGDLHPLLGRAGTRAPALPRPARNDPGLVGRSRVQSSAQRSRVDRDRRTGVLRRHLRIAPGLVCPRPPPHAAPRLPHRAGRRRLARDTVAARPRRDAEQSVAPPLHPGIPIS